MSNRLRYETSPLWNDGICFLPLQNSGKQTGKKLLKYLPEALMRNMEDLVRLPSFQLLTI